jgi:hypothetical protein
MLRVMNKEQPRPIQIFISNKTQKLTLRALDFHAMNCAWYSEAKMILPSKNEVARSYPYNPPIKTSLEVLTRRIIQTHKIARRPYSDYFMTHT